jgi:hypothetical protein
VRRNGAARLGLGLGADRPPITLGASTNWARGLHLRAMQVAWRKVVRSAVHFSEGVGLAGRVHLDGQVGLQALRVAGLQRELPHGEHRLVRLPPRRAEVEEGEEVVGHRRCYLLRDVYDSMP